MLTNEPEAEAFEAAVEGDPVRMISTASFLETAMVIDSRYGEAGGRELDLWLHRAEVEQVPVDAEQAAVARQAFHQYGKGRHRVGLNYGDCFSYALAQVSGEPLLFKGEDFSRTGLRSAIGP